MAEIENVLDSNPSFNICQDVSAGNCKEVNCQIQKVKECTRNQMSQHQIFIFPHFNDFSAPPLHQDDAGCENTAPYNPAHEEKQSIHLTF